MNRARALMAMIGIVFMIPAVAYAQNLEAGKSPAQLFSNTCAVCHKSARGLVRTVAPGSLPSFLREHYTTSREMAQSLAGYLMASGGTDTRGRPQEARQAPRGAEPSQPSPAQQTAQQPRQGQPEASPQQRPAAVEQAAPLPESPAAKRAREAQERRQARRELRAKQAQEAAAAAASERDRNRRARLSPSRIDAVTARGRDALPLGDILKEDAPTAETPSASEPKTVQTPSETVPTDPVPQVTPAPQAPESSKENAVTEPQNTAEPPADSTASTPPDAPSPPSGGPPPAPPISN